MTRRPDPSPAPSASSATTGLDDAFAAVQKLAADFDVNRAHYLAAAYQESEVRKDFIDKFLIALGWDVNHDRQKNPFEQEVKVERGVSVGGSQRRADYAFYLAPNFRDVRFFVEAKKPFGDIATPDNCFQTIRYGWNAQTPVAVLTDFEEFVVLDCRYKPDIDTASAQVLRKYAYRDYTDPERFAEIYCLFSREAVAAGSLDKYAETLPKRRGKAVRGGAAKGVFQSIDDAFLEDLDEYRGDLARAFKNRNPDLDGETLTEITQRVIDRLVFIRFLEDKMIQPDYILADFGKKRSAWEDFAQACRRLDGIYNGVVFKKHAILDSPEFEADAAVFGGICKNLSHVNSPYDFNAIPIHILGSIYERFLGNVITTTDKRARVEEKPEVRKAGGVYYTPEYIVRYIVENTVGKLIEGKSPAQIAEMRFADIACGSGSFLLGVFDTLLRYHRDWYNAHPAQAKRSGCVACDDGAWRLSLGQRRAILLNNIYGVDIDRQAVEVAQLSLYLKLLEEETTATARAYQLEVHETLLPPLDKNIVCGNSLIGTDILEGQLFEPVEEKKLNPMDFEDRFPEVMKRGGFDAIIGNPPWGQKEMGDMSVLKEYTSSRYESCGGILDLFRPFVEAGIRLLRGGGMYGQVLPDIVLLKDYQPTRKLMLEQLALERIDWWGMAFEDATIDAATVVGRKGPAVATHRVSVEIHDSEAPYTSAIPQATFHATPRNTFNLFITPQKQKILEKMSSLPVLGEICEIHEGVHSGNIRDDLFVPSRIDKSCRELYFGRDELRRYSLKWNGKFIRLSAIPKRKTKERYANGGHPEWYDSRKLLVRRTGDFVMAAIDDAKRYASNNFFLVIPKKQTRQSTREEFLCGLLNSRFITWLFRTVEPRKGRVFAEVKIKHLGNFPIPDPIDKSRHDRMVALVERMMSAKKELAAAKSDRDKDYYENKCAALDRQIDALVYELYGLTPEEIELVEGASQ